MKFLFLFLLSALLVNGAAGESEVIASVGEDVILPCYLTRPFDTSTLRVEWTHDETEDVHLYRKEEDDLDMQDKNYKDRTSLFREEMSRGNLSLKLTNVTERDAGKYSCNVKAQNFPEPFTACSITLEAVLRSDNRFEHSEDAGVSTAAVVGVSFSIVVVISVGLILLMKYRKIRTRAVEVDYSKTSTTLPV